MVKIKAIVVPVLLAAMVQAAYASSPILPEVTTAVDLSSSDINRIVCPGTINDLIFSKEKALKAILSATTPLSNLQSPYRAMTKHIRPRPPNYS